jgi:hypothetical protein
MPSDLETRSFVAHDVAGNPYRVVASRVVAPVPGRGRLGPWAFRTADGRSVRPAPAYHGTRSNPTTSP